MRVFVSSTYRNLATYREILRLALEKSGHIFLGMEHYAAQDSPPLQTCLDQLDSADVYLGVIGNIYGSSPPGADPSYTELEYRHAVKLGLPRIILIISDDAHVRVGDIDTDPSRRKRLANFTQQLMKNHTVDRFTSADQAAWKAIAAISLLQTRVQESTAPGAIQ